MGNQYTFMKRVTSICIILVALSSLLSLGHATSIYVNDIQSILLPEVSVNDEFKHHLTNSTAEFVKRDRIQRPSSLGGRGNLNNDYGMITIFVVLLPTLLLLMLLTIIIQKKRQLSNVFCKLSVHDNGSSCEFDVADYQLRKSFTIGRSSQNNLQIKNASVSIKHLCLMRHDDSLIIQDMGSSNGTQLNRRKITPWKEYLVNAGDILILGHGAMILIENLVAPRHLKTTCQDSSYTLIVNYSSGLTVSHSLDIELLRSARGVSIGRSSLSDIIISEPTISRNHIQLYMSGQIFWIKQISDINPCRINGQVCCEHCRVSVALNQQFAIASCKLVIKKNI